MATPVDKARTALFAAASGQVADPMAELAAYKRAVAEALDRLAELDRTEPDVVHELVSA